MSTKYGSKPLIVFAKLLLKFAKDQVYKIMSAMSALPTKCFFFFFFFFFQLSGTSVLQINQIYCLKVRFLCPFIQNMHRSMGTPKNCRSRHSSWWSSECEKKDFEKFKKEEKKTRKFVCSLKCSSFILKLIAENLLKI